MNQSHDSHVDLTSTIHLSQLRPVPSSTHLESILGLLSEVDKGIIAQLSPEKAMLIGVAGPAKGFRYLLDSAVTSIGREVTAAICLDDVTVSRKHAVISSNEGLHTIEDAKSLNGTYVNAVSVTSQKLSHGDEIQIGKFRFNFFTGKVN